LHSVYVFAKQFSAIADAAEPWYGTQYQREPLAPEFLQVPLNPLHNATLFAFDHHSHAFS
jgi:hypothetical protein